MMKVLSMTVTLMAVGAFSQAPPKINTNDGHMTFSLDADKNVTFQFGEETAVSVSGMASNIEDLNECCSSNGAAIVALNETVAEMVATSIAKLEQSINDTRVQFAQDLNSTKEDLNMRLDIIEEMIANNTHLTEELETTINANLSNIKMDIASLGVTSDMHQDKLDIVSEILNKTVCHLASMGYDEEGKTCVECKLPATYHHELRGCFTGVQIPLPESTTEEVTLFSGRCSSGGVAVSNNLGYDGSSKFTVGTSGTYQVTYRIKGMAGSSHGTSCDTWGDMTMDLYLVIDGVNIRCDRQDQQHYRVSRINPWTYHLNCDISTPLSAGEHTFGIYMYAEGNFAKVYPSTAAGYVRLLPSAVKTPAQESTDACKISTGNVLLNNPSRSTAVIGYRGSWSGYSDLSSLFSGPFTGYKTATGKVHFYLRLRMRQIVYTPYAGNKAQTQTVIRINGNNNYLDQTCEETYQSLNTNSISYDYSEKHIVCSFVYETNPGTTLQFQIMARSIGYYMNTYTEAGNVFRVEDLPAVQTKTIAALPSNCKGTTTRTILGMGRLKSTFTKASATGGLFPLDSHLDAVTFEVTGDKANILINFKVTALINAIYSSNARAGGVSIYPVIDNKRQAACHEHKFEIPARQRTQSGNIVCNGKYELAKGSHTIKFVVGVFGQVSFYTYKYSNLLLVEQEIEFLDYSTAI